MGAVTVRDTPSAKPAARTNVLQAPNPDVSSGNWIGMARLSPTSKTFKQSTDVKLFYPLWWCFNTADRTQVSPHQLVFPRGHQLTDVVHRVEDDVLQKFTPVHGHRTVLIHPDKHNKEDCQWCPQYRCKNTIFTIQYRSYRPFVSTALIKWYEFCENMH